jgi:hypothetical protein
MTLTAYPIHITLSWLEQQELQRFLRNPHLSHPCPVDSERITILSSLADKGYIYKAFTDKGFNYYKIETEITAQNLLP